MHRLDSHINDIEPRIRAIFQNATKQEEPSLQQSLSSYGWILLDSWVAWRTLRFLLRETYIDEKVDNKWFQTPSSYTASQLKAIWQFTDTTIDYLYNVTGKELNRLINDTIQKKRNTCAHFTKRSEVLGTDSQEIKVIFQALYKVFMLYECGHFFKAVCNKLKLKNYSDFEVCYSSGESYRIDDFFESIQALENSTSFYLKCRRDKKEFVIFISEEGCKAGCINKMGEYTFQDVVNEEQKKYNFLGNKGFYQNIDLFVVTLETCWEKGAYYE